MAEKNSVPEQQDISEILRVRREKLSALQSEGRDPFQETKFTVSHHTQEIKDQFDALEGTEVTIAGRLMSRSQAKQSFTLSEFKKQMAGIFTTSVNAQTLDECPMAYKGMQDILDNIGPTAEVVKIIRPIYNFKAGEEG